MDDLTGDFDDADFIDATVGNVDASIGGSGHVAYNAAAGRNVGAGEGLCFRIEADDGVGLGPGFTVPDHAAGGDGDAVGMGLGPTGRGVELDRAVREIEHPEVPVFEIGEVVGVVGRDGEAARSRRFRENVLLDRQSPRVDGSHLVGAEFTEHGNALAGNLYAVGQSAFGGDSFQSNLSGAGLELTHHVASLNGEKQDAVRIED